MPLPAILGVLAPIIGNVLDKFLPDPQAKAKAEGEILAAVMSSDLAQIEVNKVEAASSSLFVAGWRPAIGWIGVLAMAYQFLAYPLFQWGWKWAQAGGWVPAGMEPPPVLEADQLWVILSGILGIAGMRSFEKTKGVASK